MARQLSSMITNQITSQDIKGSFLFYVGGNHYNSYLLNWEISYDTSFGAAQATFTLNNNDGEFGEGKSRTINIGDVVEFIELYQGDSTQFKKFYGIVEQRAISKQSGQRTISLSCLDYIGVLSKWDIDMVIEGTRVEVVEEKLEPVYLDAPNDGMAQLFNFANNGIATKPLPLIKVRDINHTDNVEAQYDGFEIYYEVGQLKMGTSLNVRDNYDVLATYSYYVKGKYVEDAIEEILTQPNGYGGYLFGQPSAQHVIDLNLTTNYYNEEGTLTDTLTPNISSKTITIDTTLTQDYGSGADELYLSDTTGFPSNGAGSGTISVNGDIFTYTGKTANSLTGISGLGNHSSGDYCEFENTYSPGQIWELSYNNVQTDLTSGDFTLPSACTFRYFDKRYGRIILDSGISIGEVLTCDVDYVFKTIQATGIEINRIAFRKRETESRFSAIKELREYLAPNYIIRTQGDNKIWASYLQQKTSEDYSLSLAKGFNYMEDTDLYTRVTMWAKNENPTNIMFGDDIDYSSESEDSYTGIATNDLLSYFGEEKSGILSEEAEGLLSEAELLNNSEIQNLINYVNTEYIATDYASQDSTGYYVYGTQISSVGKVILGNITPVVFVNGVPIDNKIHTMTGVPIKIKQTTETTTTSGGKSKSVSTTALYYYEIIFPHTSIVPEEPIYLYDSQGILQYTLYGNDPNMDYGTGIWTIPGVERNDVAEVLSTATYKVLYSSDSLKIEYGDAVFKIHKSILPEPDNVNVRATYEYWAIAIVSRNINHVVDGRRDTQLQLEFFGEPPDGFHLATIDLGASYNIQAIDLVGGFYKPDANRKFDMGFAMSLKYSTDGTNFYAISDKTEIFDVQAGEAITFEEEDLGEDFEARYLKFTLESAERIEYGKGRYVVAITEVSVYSDIVLKSESKLIATTTLTESVIASDTEINVNSTSGFTEPESGETATAYIDKDSSKSFTYTGITETSFIGCSIESGVSGYIGEYVTQTITGDNTIYDNDNLLPKLGDRVYRKSLISDRNLYSQSELDNVSKSFLREFYKNHSKINVEIMYSPFLKVGQTISVTDTYNNIDGVRYFIENIKDSKGNYSLTLARYP